MAQSILRVKTSCTARTRNVQIPQGANIINYLWLQRCSWLSDFTNKRSPSPCLCPLLEQALKPLHPGDDTLSAMTATLIGHAALSDTNSIEQLWSEISEVVTGGEKKGRDSVRRQHFQNHTYCTLLLQDDVSGFKCIFNGKASFHLREFCRKLEAKEGKERNILSGDWELGQERNYMPF